MSVVESNKVYRFQLSKRHEREANEADNHFVRLSDLRNYIE